MVRVILLVMDVLDRIDYLVPCLITIRIVDVMIIDDRESRMIERERER